MIDIFAIKIAEIVFSKATKIKWEKEQDIPID